MPDGDDLVVIASNWGQRQHPAWYHDLHAHPTAAVTVGGVPRRVQAREAIGEERERLQRRGLGVYPGWAAYERRAAHRRIPGGAGSGERRAWLTRELRAGAPTLSHSIK